MSRRTLDDLSDEEYEDYEKNRDTCKLPWHNVT